MSAAQGTPGFAPPAPCSLSLGLIGNCAFLALIRKDTSVAWMCWPRFDSSFVFGDLLDGMPGGSASACLRT